MMTRRLLAGRRCADLPRSHGAGRLDRRGFLLAAGSVGAVGVLGGASVLRAQPKSGPFFDVRGVVLRPDDIRTLDWPALAKAARLTTVATHDPKKPSVVESFMRSETGREFSQACRDAGLQIEHELHVMREFLPRDLFAKNPELFRMTEDGQRDPRVNCCVSNKTTLEIVSENAAKCAKALPPTSGRYFFWIDDNKPMCCCRRCRGFSASDQALILENAMLQAVRAVDDRATLAHLAYANTLPAPKKVKPEPGIFLEFAPIERHYMIKLSRREVTGRRGLTHGQLLDFLDANLEVFDTGSAQVLEYWLNARMFYRQARETDFPLFWSQGIFLADLEEYAKRGIRRVTSFASGLDGAYVSKFGNPPVAAYGKGLWEYRG